MFPISDSAPTGRFPFINYLLIAANVIVFFLQLTAPSFERFVLDYAFIPSQFNFLNPASYFNILSSIFMHGGVFHILSNMWFLHIFGDNTEDRLGHFKYLVFYLLGGFAATFGQYILDPVSSIPMIGASGAVSAVAGAYFVFFKSHRIKTLIAYFIVWDVVELPAGFFLGYWFFIQVFSGIGSLAAVAHGGVAWFAHIAGFLFGWILARIMKRSINEGIQE